jgi:glycosyltransferase involved in cell wall biosynthesis
MRILFLSPRQCWPTHSGAKLREYHFLRALSLRGEVTYLHFTEPGFPPLTREDLPFCREVLAIPKPGAYGPWKLLGGVAGRWPLPILNYTSPEMSAAVARLTRGTKFDLVHLDAIHMMRYGGALAAQPEVKTVYNWHNIESELMQRYHDTAATPAKRWYAGRTAAKLRARETDILRIATGHVVCSPRERDQLQRRAPEARVAVVHNGVDMQCFANAGAGSAAGRDLIFVGSMAYPPNAEAAVFFSRNVWPAIRERMPDLRLMIVGAIPLPEVLALAQLPGVNVTGTVPDVRPYYGSALAAIVPLRAGSGTRLKILEAMAAGVPVISTPVGAEGLEATPGRDFLIAQADDAEEWISQLKGLAGQRESLVAAGLDLVRTHYDWEAIGEELWSTYQGWLRGDG